MPFSSHLPPKLERTWDLREWLADKLWGDDSSSDESMEDEILEEPQLLPVLTQKELDVGKTTKLVKDSTFNWFEIDETVQKIYSLDNSVTKAY